MIISCDCGCSKLEIVQDEYGYVSISHYKSSFYSEQTGILDIIKDKLNMIYCAISGKKYYFYEVIIEKKEDIREFKKMIDGIEVK